MKIKSNYIIAALAAVVVILLIVIAFMLGRRSAPQGENGTAASSDEISFSEVTSDEISSDETDSGNSEAGENASNGETQNAPRELDISMSSGSLTFVSGSEFNVDFDSSVINVTSSGDILRIQNDHNNPSASERNRMNVTVTVPDGHIFSAVDIKFGAGKLIAHSLSAETLIMELGAGSVTFDNVVVTDLANIKEGAGAFSINSGSIANLSLKCGAGATRVAAELTGSSTIIAAFGAVDIDLKGEKESYSVSFNIGLGTCYYNSEKLSRSESFGNGENSVQITGGMGVMRVNAGK